jgi:lysine decarboxylase
MADQDTVVFLATLADTREDFEELAHVLIEIAHTQQSTPRPSATALSSSVIPEVGISMRDAYFASTEMVSALNAVGRVSADLIAPYPPGVAVIAPGEILTEQIVQGLSASQKAGVRIAYATDPTLGKFRVVIK